MRQEEAHKSAYTSAIACTKALLLCDQERCTSVGTEQWDEVDEFDFTDYLSHVNSFNKYVKNMFL